MTVNEAVDLLKDWIEYVNEKKEVWREVVLTDTEGEVIAKMLLDMENEIELLKCCGNCRHWYLLAENGEIIKYCDLKLNHDYQFRTDKCDRWQKL